MSQLIELALVLCSSGFLIAFLLAKDKGLVGVYHSGRDALCIGSDDLM